MPDAQGGGTWGLETAFEAVHRWATECGSDQPAEETRAPIQGVLRGTRRGQSKAGCSLDRRQLRVSHAEGPLGPATVFLGKGVIQGKPRLTEGPRKRTLFEINPVCHPTSCFSFLATQVQMTLQKAQGLRRAFLPGVERGHLQENTRCGRDGSPGETQPHARQKNRRASGVAPWRGLSEPQSCFGGHSALWDVPLVRWPCDRHVRRPAAGCEPAAWGFGVPVLFESSTRPSDGATR